MPLSLSHEPKSSVKIVGEITADIFSNFYKEAIQEFRDKVEIKGFRRGKAPDDIVVRHVGDLKVLETAAQIALETEYPKILQEKKVRAVGNPEISITKLAKGNPLGFTIKTPVFPVIQIESYIELAKNACSLHKDDLDVMDSEVTSTIELIKKSQGEKFDANNVTKEIVRGGLMEDKKRKNIEKKRIIILEAISKEIKTNDIPDVMIENEKHKLLHETKHYISGMGMAWEEYLKHIKKTENELLNGLFDDAVKRVKFSLVLDYIAEKENIIAPESEVKKEVARIIEQTKSVDGTQLDKNKVEGYTEVIIRNEKVLQFLESLSTKH